MDSQPREKTLDELVATVNVDPALFLKLAFVRHRSFQFGLFLFTHEQQLRIVDSLITPQEIFKFLPRIETPNLWDSKLIEPLTQRLREVTRSFSAEQLFGIQPQHVDEWSLLLYSEVLEPIYSRLHVIRKSAFDFEIPRFWIQMEFAIDNQDWKTFYMLMIRANLEPPIIKPVMRMVRLVLNNVTIADLDSKGDFVEDFVDVLSILFQSTILEVSGSQIQAELADIVRDLPLVTYLNHNKIARKWFPDNTIRQEVIREFRRRFQDQYRSEEFVNNMTDHDRSILYFWTRDSVQYQDRAKYQLHKSARIRLEGIFASTGCPRLSQPWWVYRGWKKWTDIQSCLGDLTMVPQHDERFLTTSYDRSVANEFNNEDGCCTTPILLPVGTPFLILTGNSHHPEEHEVLLPPRYLFRRYNGTEFQDALIYICNPAFLDNQRIRARTARVLSFLTNLVSVVVPRVKYLDPDTVSAVKEKYLDLIELREENDRVGYVVDITLDACIFLFGYNQHMTEKILEDQVREFLELVEEGELYDKEFTTIRPEELLKLYFQRYKDRE